MTMSANNQRRLTLNSVQRSVFTAITTDYVAAEGELEHGSIEVVALPIKRL